MMHRKVGGDVRMKLWKGEEDAKVVCILFFCVCVCDCVCKGYTWVRTTTSLVIAHGGFATVPVR